MPTATETLKETPMQKYLIAGLLVAGMVSPAFAAEFYVAQSATTHKCSVMAKKPDGKTMTLIGSDDLQDQVRSHEGDEGHAECKA